MKYYSYGISDVGKIRRNNEDNFFINGYFRDDYKLNIFSYSDINENTEMSIYAVFDGMGGVQFGEEASGTAAKALKQYVEDSIEQDVDFNAGMAVRKINNAVCRVSRKLSVKSGSTIVMAVFRNNNIQVVNVGDSRAYLYRKNKLLQLSVDHNEAALYKQMNIEIDIPDAKNVLTQHLGIEESDFVLEPSITDQIEIKKDDIILLCSDGLGGYVQDKSIAEILSMDNLSNEEKARKLVSAALEKGGKDNITVVLINAK